MISMNSLDGVLSEGVWCRLWGLQLSLYHLHQAPHKHGSQLQVWTRE